MKTALIALPEKALHLAGRLGGDVSELLPRAGQWLDAGVKLGAAKTGSKVAMQFVRRHPVATVATVVGAGFTNPLDGTSFGFDFNPQIDRIRIVSDANQNFVANAPPAVVEEERGRIADRRNEIAQIEEQERRVAQLKGKNT